MLEALVSTLATVLTGGVLLVVGLRAINGPQIKFARVSALFVAAGLFLISNESTLGFFLSELGSALFLIGFALGVAMLIFELRSRLAAKRNREGVEAE